MGQRDLKCLMITGAMAVVNWAVRRDETTDPWLEREARGCAIRRSWTRRPIRRLAARRALWSRRCNIGGALADPRWHSRAMSEPTPVQNAVQAQKVGVITIAEYDRMAAAYRRGTADHDVSQNIAALLEAIEGAAPHVILDLGCGPGRDIRRFTALGQEAVGLDGSAELAAMARAKTDCEVLHQDFLALDLPSARFDGIFANASLFHVPSSQLARVLGDLAATLKPSGVLFCSNPRGDNEEGWAGGRYGCFHDLETWRAYVTAAGFLELHHYYRPPGRPRAQQPWLATVWRKSSVNHAQ